MENIKKSKVLDAFFETASNLVNPSMETWKEQGGKILGYYCSYVPEELITAAGFMPFRIRATGSKTTELADAYLTHINCSFVRHSFDLALRGDYGFTEGVVLTSSCDHVRRIYDNWKRFIQSGFIHLLALPRKSGQHQVKWYRDELQNFKDHMETHFKIKITDDKIQEAIKIHNETRSLQMKLYDLRKQEKPPISGSEILAVVVAGTCMPKAHYNLLLKELLDTLEGNKGNGNYRARLMIVGGILDDPAYLKIIEDQGGLVVADSLCFGSRIFWRNIDENQDDPLLAIAQYQIADKPSCPHSAGIFPKRADYVKHMIKDFAVDGVIAERIQFCDNWGYETYMIGDVLKEADIPFLKLEKEYLLGGVGQLRTRVQAFLETLEGGME